MSEETYGLSDMPNRGERLVTQFFYGPDGVLRPVLVPIGSTTRMIYGTDGRLRPVVGPRLDPITDPMA